MSPPRPSQRLQGSDSSKVYIQKVRGHKGLALVPGLTNDLKGQRERKGGQTKVKQKRGGEDGASFLCHISGREQEQTGREGGKLEKSQAKIPYLYTRQNSSPTNR